MFIYLNTACKYFVVHLNTKYLDTLNGEKQILIPRGYWFVDVLRTCSNIQN